MIPRYQLPRMIERGVAQTLDLDVYSDAGAQQAPSAGTLTLYAGSKVILDEVAVTAAAPSTYSLLAADTADETLSDRWLELWTLTISGTDYTFRRPAYLVRHVLYPVITDTDLTAHHSDLADLRDPDQASYQVQRTRAWVMVQRWLIGQGRRPELVLDSWALANWHTYLTLHMVFLDFALSTGTDRRYRELADHYRQQAEEARDALVMRYDADEDGIADPGEIIPAHGTLYTGAPPEWR